MPKCRMDGPRGNVADRVQHRETRGLTYWLFSPIVKSEATIFYNLSAI